MGRPEAVGLRYTSRELLGYVNDPHSCVRRLTDRLHIGLPPAGLANFKEAVVDSVNNAKIGHFDAKLDGIVLDVRNIKVLGNAFAIHTDHPELHVDLMADLHVFRPTVGASIRGIIKHIAKSHISVTIHRVFNVAIRLAAGSASRLAVNAEITIRVTDFDLKDTIPYIAGVLDQPLALPSALKKTTASGKSVAKVTTPNDADEEDDEELSDADDDNRSVMVDLRVPIKKEPRSDRSDHSDSDTSAHDSEPDSLSEERSAKPSKKVANPSSASEDSDSEAEVPLPKIIRVKQEKPSTSSSDSDSGTEVPDTKFPTKSPVVALRSRVKSEQSAAAKRDSSKSSSDDDEPTSAAVTVKREPHVAGSHTKRKSAAAGGAASPAKRTVIDSLALKRVKRQLNDDDAHTPAKRNKQTNNDSLDDTSAFATPGMSSTMLPESRIKRKSVKK